MAFRSLASAVSEQCHEIKQALATFSYFESWDASAVAECCRLASVAEFAADAVVLGSETGNVHAVHFLLEGTCTMVRRLKVRTRARTKTVRRVGRTLAEEAAQSEFASATFRLDVEARKAAAAGPFQGEGRSRKSDDEAHGRGPSQDSAPRNRFEGEPGEITGDGRRDEKRGKSGEGQDGRVRGAGSPEEGDGQSAAEAGRGPEPHLKMLEECRRTRTRAHALAARGGPGDTPPTETAVFVRLGFLLRGSCFGLEENWGRGLFIVTLTRARCLRIPRRFLLRHDPGNVWSRIRLFHSLYLPGEETLLDHVRSDREWSKRKSDETRGIVSVKRILDYASVADVPVSIRLGQTRPAA